MVTPVSLTNKAVTLLKKNNSRKLATIYNSTKRNAYIKFGPNATIEDYSFVLHPYGYFEVPKVVTGIITAVALTISAYTIEDGKLMVTEL